MAKTVRTAAVKGGRKRRAHSPYSLVEGGPVQRAFELRISGASYPKIVETLRTERPDECGTLDAQTVARWVNKPPLHLDTIIALSARVRAERLPKGATVETEDRLAEVRELIEFCVKGLTGKLEDVDDAKERLKGVRFDTFYQKLLAEERRLSHGDLASIPQRTLERVVMLVMGELVTELVERSLVSPDRLKSAASDIERSISKRMRNVLRSEAAADVIPSGRV